VLAASGAPVRGYLADPDPGVRRVAAQGLPTLLDFGRLAPVLEDETCVTTLRRQEGAFKHSRSLLVVE
jgi:hypothetical protein